MNPYLYKPNPEVFSTTYKLTFLYQNVGPLSLLNSGLIA